MLQTHEGNDKSRKLTDKTPQTSKTRADAEGYSVHARESVTHAGIATNERGFSACKNPACMSMIMMSLVRQEIYFKEMCHCVRHGLIDVVV